MTRGLVTALFASTAGRGTKPPARRSRRGKTARRPATVSTSEPARTQLSAERTSTACALRPATH